MVSEILSFIHRQTDGHTDRQTDKQVGIYRCTWCYLLFVLISEKNWLKPTQYIYKAHLISTSNSKSLASAQKNNSFLNLKQKNGYQIQLPPPQVSLEASRYVAVSISI